jgi:hypothetical protein
MRVPLRILTLALTATLATAVFSPRARAAEGGAAGESTPDRELLSAKDDFEAAQTLFLKEQYEPAALKFLSAFGKKPFPAFLFNAAVAYEKAKQLEKAEQYFERYLEKDPGATDAAQVKARIDTLRVLLAPPPPPPPPTPALVVAPGAPPGGPTGTPPGGPAGTPPPPTSPGSAAPTGGPVPSGPGPILTPPPVPVAPPVAAPPPPPSLPAIDTKGLVVIDSKPQGATIYLNDKKKGPFAKTPWQGSLESAPVRLLLEAKGFKPEQRNISPRSDKLVDIYIALSEEHYLGWVEIVSNVPGALVFIDRKEIGAIGQTPYTGNLKPGKHTIYLERKGYVAAEKQIDVLPGTAIQHTISMDRSRNGWVAANGAGALGSRLLIDDKFACNMPCEVEAPPGKHQVEVEKEGMENYQAEIHVEQAIETVIDVRFSPRPPRTRAISKAVVALVFIGAGAYVGHLSDQNKDALDREIKAGQPVESNDPRFQRGKLEAIGADVLYGIGALVAVSAVFTFFAHGPDSYGAVDQRMVSFAPQITRQGGGLGLVGRF